MVLRAAPILISVCTLASPAIAKSPLCSGDAMAVYADFEQARATACRFDASGALRVEIAPEAMPINPSPWFAFDIIGKAERDLTVILEYRTAAHRYGPWLKVTDGAWSLLKQQAGQNHAAGHASFIVPPFTGQATFAAAPIEPVYTVLASYRKIGVLTEMSLGQTRDGRAIIGFMTKPEQPKGVVVLVARQHPPEKTGGWAFDSFIQALLDDAQGRNVFRNDIQIIVVPVANPDGIARGNWRGNASGTDLNRDWSAQKERETAAIATMIKAVRATTPIVAVFDFHSTRENLIYAAPEAAENADLGETFIATFRDTAVGAAFDVRRSHETGRGTLKAWSRDHLAVNGMTFEVADNALPADAQRLGAIAADALVAAWEKGQKK